MTLVEVVIGSALLLLAFGALLLTFTRMQHSSVAAQNSLHAMHIARNEVEMFRTGSWSDIISYTNVVLTNTVLSALGGRKHCSVVTPTNSYKEIELTITWFNPTKPDRSSLSIGTKICNTN